MTYKVTVETIDENEYELNKSFRTREEAEREAEDIVTGGDKYIGDELITAAWVE